jgi:hypothetical protein
MRIIHSPRAPQHTILGEKEGWLILALLKLLPPPPRWGEGRFIDDKESRESVPLFGVDLVDGSPTFSLDNDQVADSPTDNEVSKYSFYQRLTHYMEGHKISEFNRAAVQAPS